MTAATCNLRTSQTAFIAPFKARPDQDARRAKGNGRGIGTTMELDTLESHFFGNMLLAPEPMNFEAQISGLTCDARPSLERFT
jgi:hypothetical protein